MLDKKTIAEQVTECLGGDGKHFPENMDEILAEYCKYPDRPNGWGASPTRYVFDDGSCIIVGDVVWDVGLSQDCYCMRENRHHSCHNYGE